MIPYGRQDVTEADIDAVANVLRSDFLTQGAVVPRFERSIAEYCGVSHAVAVNSATSALHVAALALGLGPGDWLWTSPITFVASANCGLYCGAKVDFVDIDPVTFNMSVEALRAKLEKAAASGRLPKVVVVVHMAGQSCDMEGVEALAREYNFKVIEDASHGIGARYKGRPVGCCQYSDITVFSFHPVKIITTAEGGVAVTNDPGLARRMELFRSHGITRETSEMTHEPHGNWYYQQIELGFNYRMTEMQAALGCSQMDRLDDYVKRRHDIAKRYDALLSDLPLRTPLQRADCYSAFHLYIISLDLDKGINRRNVFDKMRAQGIGVNVHYIPVHLQPYYAEMGKDVGYDASSLPNACDYYSGALSIPMYPTMREVDQDFVVETLRKALA